MAAEYPLAQLGKYASVQGGFAFKSSDFANSGIPVLKIKNVRLRRVDVSEVDCVAREVADHASRFFCKTGDLLISMTGSGPQAPNSVVGRVARFNGPSDRFLINQRVGRFVIKDHAKLDSRFLFYVLTQGEYQQKLVSIATGSANQANISPDQIESLDIPLFPIDEQRAIARILGTLDDKIELNQRMNETLEALARAMFKSWFVDFDPVRAKAEGRDPGLPKPTADLFPDSFEDSELGEIPKGWKVRSLDEIARFLNGLALQKYPPKDGRSLPVIKIAQLRAGNTDGADAASAELESDYIVEDGDVLFSWSGSLECVLWAGGRGALNQHLFRVTSVEYPKWFYYLWVKHHLPAFQTIAAGKATTMGHIQRYHLTEALVCVPLQPLLDRMDKVIAPLIGKQTTNSIESRTLATLRDTLLPKLISGEIRVKGMERLNVTGVEVVRQSAEPIYTIGHSNHSVQYFISLLKRHGIGAIADVRSSPFSRRHPQFNRDTLADALRKDGIAYVFLGKELGARSDDPRCYDNGQANFERMAESPTFKQGIDRLLKGKDQHRIALLCAEKEPLDCHRTILVSRNLRKLGVPVKHIMADGSIEEHQDTERRLVGALGLQNSLFEPVSSDSERLEKAYSQQACKIAYKRNDTEDNYEHAE